MTEPEYLSVSDLTTYLRRKFDMDPYLTRVFLTGELSNFRLRPGHQYFSLKDDGAKISAVMFKGAFAKLKFRPEEGMKVRVVGHVTLYNASGQYQIVIESMEPDGVGALYQALEQLKAKLAAEGLFAKNQRPLVRFPKRVAVITSPSGAVIQDIRTTVARRYPILQLVLYPAVVQGTAAAGDLVRQLRRVREAGDYDALIIGRGGGSIEDLWPFNEEAVARELAAMPMPVVSSVGHETDVTITDFVADHRAATPTAAAELVTPVPLVDALARLEEDRLRVVTATKALLANQAARLARVQASVVMTQPTRLYDQYVQQLDQLTGRLTSGIQAVLADRRHRLTLGESKLQPQALASRLAALDQRLAQDQVRLGLAAKAHTEAKRAQLAQAAGALDHLSPLKILGRGYSYVTDESGTMLKTRADFHAGQHANIHLEDGIVPVVVEERKTNNG
ncbi:exodeoxyribonuclease VII large subunit [Lacticaseibacillus kribbianus]|uniref:exodeoxyribonuclease VII large subunit n=1 Tax=Lacticaseibacillus kribbianus TaxID=2926292 RepID=UPI001CD4E027|nr:exodeoxyribonuclease VII large subunit [Lacticaseibacillus kribbianus]